MPPSHPISRRRFLQTGSLLSLGLGLAEVARLRGHATDRDRPEADTAVILVYLTGGLSQLDTYDLKPDAPAEHRGDFIRGSTDYGLSEKHAAAVRDNPFHPADICATICHAPGIDPDLVIHDRSGRPVPVANGGKPIRDILG
ncbi:MAG: DUF1501 domain-containing protein [Gemmataceae bacterium]